ncbi:hypothetical protein [Quadrisphaera sp. INWT6]|uniref:hypothetical protein n=1 Tax=Quadrisphaera sp. INWT6 TaxID=2596917 RepID=UPI0018925C76|nr:hypothetical protein [Quadrisphaera sp. INWT6]MBF5081618.1 hypothetical protein [Quadrisphaera sp. INWT6]
MSDPYAPPGSRREPDRDQDAREGGGGWRPPGAPAPRPGAHDAPRGGSHGGSHRGAGPGHPPPGRTPPDPAGALRTARLGLRFLLLVLAGLVAMSLPWPWSLGALGFLLAGGVVGVIALVVAAQAHLRASQLVALSIGLAMTGVIIVLQLASLVVWQPTAERDQCRRTAVTDTSLRACDTTYREQLRSFSFLPPTSG